MRNKLFAVWARFISNNDGVTLVEYGVALSLVITVGTALLVALGGDVNDKIVAASAVLTQ